MEKLELAEEEDCKEEEVKKKEIRRKTLTTMKKEDQFKLDLSVKTKNAYLRGLGPGTRQGPVSPTSSYLDSGDLSRGSRTSSAGPSLRGEDNQGHKVLE